MESEQDLDQVLAGILERMKQEVPDLWVILDAAKRDGASAPEVMGKIQEYLKGQRPEPNSLMALFFSDILQDAVPARTTRSEHGMPRLNPLVEAALIERVQFDQDIPELRTGPAPSNVRPAVPIDTQARSPQALGQMLKNAATTTRKKLNKLDQERRQLADDVAAGKPGALAIIARHGELVAQQEAVDLILQGSQKTDLPGYRRGELPVPLKTKTPSGSALARMTPKEQRAHAWLFLSTTQGRRSAVATIRGIVAEQLQKRGLKVLERDYKPEVQCEPLVVHEWRVNLMGAGSIQPALSLIDMSARALAAGLIKELPNSEVPLKSVTLEVTTIDRLGDRQVGWTARLLPGG